MKYMLLIRVNAEAQPTSAEADPSAWVAEGKRRKMLLTGSRLLETTDATTVRVREGKTLVTDGPFAEFKEHIAGYDLIEAPGLAEAVAFAELHPVAKFGAIEVREVWEDFEHARDTSPA